MSGQRSIISEYYQNMARQIELQRYQKSAEQIDVTLKGAKKNIWNIVSTGKERAFDAAEHQHRWTIAGGRAVCSMLHNSTHVSSVARNHPKHNQHKIKTNGEMRSLATLWFWTLWSCQILVTREKRRVWALTSRSCFVFLTAETSEALPLWGPANQKPPSVCDVVRDPPTTTPQLVTKIQVTRKTSEIYGIIDVNIL